MQSYLNFSLQFKCSITYLFAKYRILIYIYVGYKTIEYRYNFPNLKRIREIELENMKFYIILAT